MSNPLAAIDAIDKLIADNLAADPTWYDPPAVPTRRATTERTSFATKVFSRLPVVGPAVETNRLIQATGESFVRSIQAATYRSPMHVGGASYNHTVDPDGMDDALKVKRG